MSQEMDGGGLTLLLLIGYFYWVFCHWASNQPPTDLTAARSGPGWSSLPLLKRTPDACPLPEDIAQWGRPVEPGSAAAEALVAIRFADRTFDAVRFLRGAVDAYRAVLVAFAERDLRLLADLTAAEVYDGFVAVIEAREAGGERPELELLNIEAVTVVDGGLEGHRAWITVRFSSRFMRRGQDAGASADDVPDSLVDLADEWTFARDLWSADPNWQLVATAPG